MRAATLSPTSTTRRARDVAPGTCGELAQGILPDGRGFVVTCPIDLTTTVDIVLTPAAATEIVGAPVARPYLERALRRTAERIELEASRIAVAHHTRLPVGKGMASSTADIVAASRALARAAGVELLDAEVAEIAAAIEPSDGVMYEGVVAADRATGALLRTWNWWPSFTVVVVIPPTTFRTAAARFDGQARLAGEYAVLLDRLDAAVEARDASAFAEVATRSAVLGQPFVPNDAFAVLEPRTAEFGALGVCAAHTGTVAGLLFPRTREGDALAARAQHALHRSLPDAFAVSIARTPVSPPAGP